MVSKFNGMQQWFLTFFFFSSKYILKKTKSYAKTQCTQQTGETLTWFHQGRETQNPASCHPPPPGVGIGPLLKTPGLHSC